MFGVSMAGNTITCYKEYHYTLSGIKSRTVGDGQHGTARWATDKEIKQTYAHVPFKVKDWRKGVCLPAEQGLVLGCKGKKDELTALVDSDDIHCLMIAASGAGKTAFFLYPNLEYACASGMSFLALDTKGDLARNYGSIAKKYYGYKHISVIDLRNPTRSDGNNLLTLINRYMDIARKQPDNLAARLMGVSRQYIYKLVKEDKLRASRISGRMALVRRADIELMLKSKPYERLVAKNDFNISEYYTAEEIAEKYKVNAKWVWTYTRQHKVPKVRIRQFNYYSKKHIDAAFAKYEVDSDLTEWYTPEEIQEKYGMTRVAIRSQVYRNNIPSKKEHGQIFYSKLHFDLSKSSEQESKAEYYTVKEAMEKFKLSRDSVYGILQFHQINREKNGRFVRFLKVEFDRVMGVRK